jgi:hypothetical protein
MNELETARAISTGELESPQKFDNMSLYAVRITGTGVAFRSKIDEFTYRNPDNYLTQEFCDRCAALPVIWWHPEGDLLTSEEYGKRVIGAIMFAYILDDEIWGIARVNDDDAIKELDKQQLSTSPCFTFAPEGYNVIDDNKPLMIEGAPVLLDHLAICAEGVWDKGGEPLGVNTQQPVMRSDSMDETTKAPAAVEPSLADVLQLLTSISGRIDALEAPAPTPAVDANPIEVAGDPELGKNPVIASDNEDDMARNVAKADDDCAADDDASGNRELEEKVVAADSQIKDLKSKIAMLESRIPRILTDEDRSQLSTIQAKADKIASAFGDAVAAPLPGEEPASYKRRCLDKFKQYSAAWKNIDLSKLSADVLGVAEVAIYADAAMAAKMPESYGAVGGLREIVKRQRGGGEIVEFVGNQAAWMGDFKAPGNKIAGFSKGF